LLIAKLSVSLVSIDVSNPVEILLIEDSQGDAELTRLALEEGTVPVRLVVVEDGEEGLRYLRREGEFKDAKRPSLILLDLNLPRLSGREVLAELKTDRELASIPVLVLSSSAAEQDITESYRAHANCYLQKPTGLPGFTKLAASVHSFWLETAKLPASGA
jgi:chemotaxis family two-component system response regulator Rcp1